VRRPASDTVNDQWEYSVVSNEWEHTTDSDGQTVVRWVRLEVYTTILLVQVSKSGSTLPGRPSVQDQGGG
jgi:hypothetical protein